MTASKDRPQWTNLPATVRSHVQDLLGGSVTEATNCPGGFSAGFASRLRLSPSAPGQRGRAFVKAIDSDAWPVQGEWYRDEARIAAALPAAIPAPALLGTFDDGHWVVLAFEDIEGHEPPQPWRQADLGRAVTALRPLAAVTAPSLATASLRRDHPRLGGWADVACEPACRVALARLAPWADRHLNRLIDLEADGIGRARGDALVHGDLYPFNILLTRARVFIVDWSHARWGSPAIDLISLLVSAAADGLDPEPFLHAETTHPAVPARADAAGPPDPLPRARPTAGIDLSPAAIDGILAAHAGFLIGGAVWPDPNRVEAIVAAKERLGLGALNWLRRRLTTSTP